MYRYTILSCVTNEYVANHVVNISLIMENTTDEGDVQNRLPYTDVNQKGDEHGVAAFSRNRAPV